MTEQKLGFTIFYAWQSDTPKNHGRHLVREALEQACETLGEEFPYAIDIDSDTKDEPGLCDVPDVILTKIANADAVVLDMTFIAKTDADKPKYCPNPNVTFELGYAFNAIGSERLICVMNEKHGDAIETMFDVAHRRHPIGFTSPTDGVKRAETVKKLAGKLTSALRLTLKLGPRTAGVDDGVEFERELSEILNFWRHRKAETANRAHAVLRLRPTHYVQKRWPDLDVLREAFYSTLLPKGRWRFPPCEVDTIPMEWGFYNDAYECPTWAFTRSGQFVAVVDLAARTEHELESNVPQYQNEFGSKSSLAPGEWVDYLHARSGIADVFSYFGSLSRLFHEQELLHWSAVADKIAGTCLSSSNSSARLELGFGTSRICHANYAKVSGTEATVEFRETWGERCASFLHEVFEKFDLYGMCIDVRDLRQFVDARKLGRA